MEQENVSLEKAKAHPDRKQIVYIFNLNYKVGCDGPWLKLIHELPNIDKFQENIIEGDGELVKLREQLA